MPIFVKSRLFLYKDAKENMHPTNQQNNLPDRLFLGLVGCIIKSSSDDAHLRSAKGKPLYPN